MEFREDFFKKISTKPAFKSEKIYVNAREGLKKRFNDDMKLIFKITPLIAFTIIAIILPILDFKLINDEIYNLNPALYGSFFAQNYYGLSYIFGFFAMMFIMSCFLAFLVYYSTTSDLILDKIDILHPDECGGFKLIGDVTIRNIFVWSTFAVIGIFNAANLLVTKGSGVKFIVDIFVISLIITGSFLIFWISVLPGHKFLLNKKYEAFNSIDTKFDEEFKKFRMKQESKLQDLHETEIIHRLNLTIWSNYYKEAQKMREWPFKNNILAQFIIAILIQIGLGLSQFFI
ncbi:MAG: hypothetical protein ACTSRL_13685 [Candidatus Helarchaeota archaeon]